MKLLPIKDLEKRAFSVVFQDGLWDVLVGFFMAQFAVSPLLGDLGLNDFLSSLAWTIVILIALTAIYILKRRIVIPRIGTVRFRKRNRSRIAVVLGLLNAFLLAGIMMCMLYLYVAEKRIDWLPPLTFMIVVMTGFSAVAWLFRQPHFYLYGFLCAVAFAGGELLYRYAGARHHGLPIVFGILSSAVVLTGLFKFAVFLRSYPKAGTDSILQMNNNGKG